MIFSFFAYFFKIVIFINNLKMLFKKKIRKNFIFILIFFLKKFSLNYDEIGF